MTFELEVFEPKEQLSIKVDSQMLKRLDNEARRLKTTRAKLCRSLMRHALSELENQEKQLDT